jgi:peptidyl-prolyl cis-trans isomerase A (cyclophilin A)
MTMNRTRLFFLPIVAFAVACSSQDTPPADTTTVAPPPTPAAAPALPPAPDEFQVRLETSKGPIVIAVHRDWSPNGVDRFHHLVETGYFDDVRFFRVVPGFVVQFGMHGDPARNAEWANNNLMDEPVKQSNRRGTVTYAKTMMPNTRSSQLFINLADNSSSLDAQGFAPFGEVVQGMDVVEKLNAEYGGAPSDRQGAIAAEGNAFLKREYPRLDFIRTAKVVK